MTCCKSFVFVPYFENYMIAQSFAHVSHDDCKLHTLYLSECLREKRNIVSVVVASKRVSGCGHLRYYPLGNALYVADACDGTLHCVLLDGGNRLVYSLTHGGDDFDLFCGGYVCGAEK